MKTIRRTIILFFLPMLTAGFARARTPAMENEFWPKVNVSFELRPQTRLRCMSRDKTVKAFPISDGSWLLSPQVVMSQYQPASFVDFYFRLE